MGFDIGHYDIFPNTVLKYGQKAKEEWAIEGQHISYVAGGILSDVFQKMSVRRSYHRIAIFLSG